MDENEINDIIKYVVYDIIGFIESEEFYKKEFCVSKKKKNVTFNEFAQYQWIINRDYIDDENIKYDLWWSSSDFLQFRNEASFELSMFIQINPTANKYKYSKTLWYELDFDSIYQFVIIYGVIPIELIQIKN